MHYITKSPFSVRAFSDKTPSLLYTARLLSLVVAMPLVASVVLALAHPVRISLVRRFVFVLRLADVVKEALSAVVRCVKCFYLFSGVRSILFALIDYLLFFLL